MNHAHLHYTDDQIHTLAVDIAEVVIANLHENGCTCSPSTLQIDVSIPRCPEQAPWHTVFHTVGCPMWECRLFALVDCVTGGEN